MKYDDDVTGGGITGLTTAMRIKEMAGELKIAIHEKESMVARHQTGNNSGIIHAGVYFKPDSLKAVICRTGYAQLIGFCNKEGIRYELCGKIIVATHEKELGRLEELYKRAVRNGFDRVLKIPGAAIGEYESHATGIVALWTPYTGIIDFEFGEFFSSLGWKGFRKAMQKYWQTD